MADTATIQTRIDEAETALHLLQTGARVVKIQTTSGTAEYALADSDKLVKYITWLKGQITTRRPIYFEFLRF